MPAHKLLATLLELFHIEGKANPTFAVRGIREA
jgi:hypothetical protein